MAFQVNVLVVYVYIPHVFLYCFERLWPRTLKLSLKVLFFLLTFALVIKNFDT